MSVTQVGTTQVTTTPTVSAASVTFTIPNSGGSPALVDDVMLAAIGITSSSQTVTTPTNWNLALNSNVATAGRLYILWKPVTAADLAVGSITFSYSGFTNEAAEFMVVRGADTVAPITLGSVVSSGTFIASYTIPAVAGITGGLLTEVFTVEGSNDLGSATPPAGFSGSFDLATGHFMGMGLAYQALVSTGSTGTKTQSFAGGNRAGQGLLVAFNPATVPGAVTLTDTVQDYRQRGGVAQLGKFTRLGK